MHAGTGSNWLRVGRRASVDGITMTTGGRVPSPRGTSARAAGAADGAAQRSDEPRGQ
jgi:hypothetical protein